MDHEDKVMKGLGKQKGAGEENGETQAEGSLGADDGEGGEVVEISLQYIRCNPRGDVDAWAEYLPRLPRLVREGAAVCDWGGRGGVSSRRIKGQEGHS
jgi:hypothetical protein